MSETYFPKPDQVKFWKELRVLILTLWSVIIKDFPTSQREGGEKASPRAVEYITTNLCRAVEKDDVYYTAKHWLN